MAAARDKLDPRHLCATCRAFPSTWTGRSGKDQGCFPGAAELVTDLRSEGIGVVFASNCSRHGSPLLCQQLADLGIAVAPPDVFTPFDLVGDEISAGWARCRCW